MLLKGQNGNEFELALTRESLPDLQDAIAGDSWATVSFRVATADASWEETAPCLNAYEFERLAEWLETVVSRDPATEESDRILDPESEIDLPEAVQGDVTEIELLEPELKFSVSQQFRDAVTLRVGFHLQDRPEEFNVDTDTDEALFVDLHMSRENVLLAAQELRASLEDLRLLHRGVADREAGGDEDDAALLPGFEQNPAIITRLVDESATLQEVDDDLDDAGSR